MVNEFFSPRFLGSKGCDALAVPYGRFKAYSNSDYQKLCKPESVVIYVKGIESDPIWRLE